MKKKSREKKKADMPEFTFKEFTAEEGRIYTEAVEKFREAIAAGKTLRQAYEGYAVADKELEKIIQADFLKIVIAERHFAKNEPLERIAKDLDVSTDLVRDTHARMLQEVGITTANQFGQEFGGLDPKTND
jgi:hypothetical protein